MIASNGSTSKAEAIRDEDAPVSAAEEAREADYRKNWAQRAFDNFARRSASALLLVVLADTVIIAVVVARERTPVVEVYHVEQGAKLVYDGLAQPSLTPGNAIIANQLSTYIKARRNIPASPNGDYSMAQQNIDLVYSMSVDAPPYHEVAAIDAYYAANNPKVIGKTGETRVVLDPVVASPVNGTATTWSVSWVEVTTSPDGTKGKPHLVLNSTLTIAPPTIQPSTTNAAGVKIVAEDLNLQ